MAAARNVSAAPSVTAACARPACRGAANRGRRAGRSGRLLDEAQRVFEHRLGLGREAGDDVGAEHHLRPQRRNLRRTPDRIVAQCRRFMRFRIMSSPGLQERCRCGISRFGRRWPHQRRIGLDGIDRGDAAAAAGPGRFRIDCTSLPSVGVPGRSAVGGDVDAGQHHFAIARSDEPLICSTTGAHRHRARRAAAIGDDAEGAAMVAAVLHLHEGAGARRPCRRSDGRRSRAPP
jgi:hypothetical protein